MMSRIGKVPVDIADGVEVKISGQDVVASGKNGELTQTFPEDVSIKLEGKQIFVSPVNATQRARAMWGLSRSLIQNMVQGVSEGFSITLEINGVGYRAAVNGKNLEMALGFSHPVVFPIPEGVTIACTKPTELVISGANKQQVGQVAAKIRSFRPPEPYKGKGIKYSTERIRRKEGKKK